MLPTPVSKQFFKQLNSCLTQFIWRNKPPRIKITVLQSPLEKGGLKVPNFEYYYWAAQFRAVWTWQTQQAHPPIWKNIEQHHLNNLQLESVPYVSSLRSLLTITTNPFIIHTYKIWQQARKRTGCIRPIYDNSPFHVNPSLPKSVRDGITKLWFMKGIKKYGNLFKNGIFMTFEELISLYGQSRTHFLKYLQVRHFIISEQGGHLQKLEELPLDKLIRDREGVRGFISYAYSGISQIVGWDVLGVKQKWEEDLGFIYEEIDWEALCIGSQYFSFNARHKITQYNLIHRIYYTPDRLHRMNPQLPQFCPRCKTEVGTLMHMFWVCPRLNHYWSSILEALNSITGIAIPAEPRLTLLGDTSIINLNLNKLKCIRIALITANKCIAMHWKDKQAPTFSRWINELASCLPNERIMYNLKAKPGTFEKIWGGLLTFLNTEIVTQPS